MAPRALVRPTVVVVLALLGAIAGCSDGGNGKGDAAPAGPTASTGPTASATTAYAPPLEPPPPVPVDSPDKTRAAIFVLAWFETLNYGYAAGDADPLRQSVGLGCFTCLNWISEVQTQSDLDQSREAGFVHVRDLAFIGPSNDDYLFRARLDRDPGVLTTPDGTRTPVDAGSGEVVDLTVGLLSSSLTDTTTWAMKAVTAPAG